nr:MAG TPA: hypothetical protein [Caudoviricetes sp.]
MTQCQIYDIIITRGTPTEQARKCIGVDALPYPRVANNRVTRVHFLNLLLL